MEPRGTQVNIGAVQAAWDQASGLRGGQSEEQWEELGGRIAAATELYGRTELVRGTVLLIGGALTEMIGEAPGVDRFREDFTGKLLDKLSRTDFVDPSDLPMVREVVTVALQGRDVVAWWDKVLTGPLDDSHRRAMTCTLAYISEFIDLVYGTGACQRRLLTALGQALQFD